MDKANNTTVFRVCFSDKDCAEITVKGIVEYNQELWGEATIWIAYMHTDWETPRKENTMDINEQVAKWLRQSVTTEDPLDIFPWEDIGPAGREAWLHNADSLLTLSPLRELLALYDQAGGDLSRIKVLAKDQTWPKLPETDVDCVRLIYATKEFAAGWSNGQAYSQCAGFRRVEDAR